MHSLYHLHMLWIFHSFHHGFATRICRTEGRKHVKHHVTSSNVGFDAGAEGVVQSTVIATQKTGECVQCRIAEYVLLFSFLPGEDT